MTFVDHALQGAVLLAAPATAAGAPPGAVWTLFAAGAVLGAWPDIAGPWKARSISRPDWKEYHKWHYFQKPFYLTYLPPVLLHITVDKPFHRVGGKWWPRLWWLCMVGWASELSGMAYVVGLI